MPMPAKRNHLRTFLEQVPEYWFHGPQRRLARDAGVPETTLSRIIREGCTPSYPHICRIISVLEEKLGKRIDPREVFEP